MRSADARESFTTIFIKFLHAIGLVLLLLFMGKEPLSRAQGTLTFLIWEPRQPYVT
jgi:hypothetical protein